MTKAKPGPRTMHPLSPLKSKLGYRTRDWNVASRATLLSAQRYSVFVKFMKGVLPVAAIGLGLAVAVYVFHPRDTGQLALTFERLGRIEGDLSMVRPRLTGTDDTGLPFSVTAASATQINPGSDSVQLEQVAADIGLKDGTKLHVTAAKGVVDTKRHLLDVSGGIHFSSNDGYDARTESASADLQAGTVHGEQAIAADGKFGHITAERFALDRNAQQLRFSGKVHMLLHGVGPRK